MKKAFTILLTLLLLAGLLVSCTTPDAPPEGDGTGTSDTTEQSTEAQTDSFFTPSEWSPEVKAFWDAFLDGTTAQPETISITCYSVFSSTMEQPEDITDASKISAILTALRESNSALTKPVSYPTAIGTDSKSVTWSTENGSFRFFIGHASPIEGGTLAGSFYCLSLTLTEGEQNFTTSFELTSEQYSTLKQKLSAQ